MLRNSDKFSTHHPPSSLWSASQPEISIHSKTFPTNSDAKVTTEMGFLTRNNLGLLRIFETHLYPLNKWQIQRYELQKEPSKCIHKRANSTCNFSRRSIKLRIHTSISVLWKIDLIAVGFNAALKSSSINQQL